MPVRKPRWTGGSGSTHEGLKEQREGVHEICVDTVVVVEPDDRVLAIVQAVGGVEVERLIRFWHVQCDQSFWRDAVYRVQSAVVDQVDAR